MSGSIQLYMHGASVYRPQRREVTVCAHGGEPELLLSEKSGDGAGTRAQRHSGTANHQDARDVTR